MATTKFDPFRKTGGTIELVRDAKTGAYSTKTVGFASVPVINLPKLGVVEVADDAAATKKKADEELQTQTASAFQAGGADDRDKDLDFTKLRIDTDEDRIDEAKKFSDAITKTSIENQEAQEKAAGIGIQPIKTPEVFMGEFAGTGPDRGPQEDPDEGVFVGDEMAFDQRATKTDTSIVPSRNDLTTGQIRQLNRGGRVTVNGKTFTKGEIDKATIDRGAAFPDDRFGEFGARVGTTPIAGEFAGIGPDRGNQTLGISAAPTGATGTKAAKEADFASGRLGIQKVDTGMKVASGFGVDPTAQTVTEQRADAQVKEEIKKKVNTGFPSGIKIAGDIIGGVLKSFTKEPSVMDKFKTGRFQTRGDLGSSTDSGRIVDIDSNGNRTVFDGFNRNSAFGNLGNSAQKRTDKVADYAAKNRNKATELRRSAAGLPPGRKKDAALAKAAKYEAKAKRQQEKADKYQEQVNKYNKEKPVTGTTKPGQSGGTDNTRDSGKIVCTMMNESYGFGSFRNKIWMKFHKDISPEYQKGYHKLFLPLCYWAGKK